MSAGHNGLGRHLVTVTPHEAVLLEKVSHCCLHAEVLKDADRAQSRLFTRTCFCSPSLSALSSSRSFYSMFASSPSKIADSKLRCWRVLAYRLESAFRRCFPRYSNARQLRMPGTRQSWEGIVSIYTSCGSFKTF